MRVSSRAWTPAGPLSTLRPSSSPKEGRKGPCGISAAGEKCLIGQSPAPEPGAAAGGRAAAILPHVASERVTSSPGTGTGSLTAAVETASGRKALVVGKPNTYMFDCIVERFGIDPSRTLMVGDRLETDILFGKNCGLSTILTLTGVSRLEEALAYMASDSAAAKDMVPNYYVNSIADLIPGLDE